MRRHHQDGSAAAYGTNDARLFQSPLAEIQTNNSLVSNNSGFEQPGSGQLNKPGGERG